MRLAAPLILLLIPVVLVLGCSGDDPAGPGGDPRIGVDVGDLPLGPLDPQTASGYRLWSPGTPPAQAEVVAYAASRVLKDPDNTDAEPVVVRVETADQRLFTFHSLAAADLLGTSGTQPSSGVSVRGTLLGDPVAVNAVDYFGPPGTDLRSYAAQALAGLELEQLTLEISSTGGSTGDDLAVGFLELTRSATALLRFKDVAEGTFEHVFQGEFELTWTGEDDRPAFLTDPEGRLSLADPVRDNLAAAVLDLERADGGLFRCDALWAADLDDVDPGDSHNDSLLRLEGFQGDTSLGAEEFTPTGSADTRFATVTLQDAEISRLRITLRSYCGSFKCDELALVALLLTVSE